MAKLIITTGPTASGKTTWARERAKAHNWTTTGDLREAGQLLNEGINVVLDSEYLTGHDIDIRSFHKQREYKPYSKEEEN